MKSYEIGLAINELKPEAKFYFMNNDYSTIVWEVLEGEPPSWEEVQTAHIALKEKANEKAIKAAEAKSALLNKLGITEEEAKLLLS
jgi:parvulin-like peptidyl-prolyl isomerase